MPTSPEPIKAHVTYTAFDYRCFLEGIVFDREQLGRAAAALYTALRRWGARPADVKSKVPASAAEPLVAIEMAAGKYTVELSSSGLRVMIQWVDWGQAVLIQEVIQACLSAIAVLPAPIQRQSAVIAIQVVPDSDQGIKVTLPLASPAVLAAGGVNCFGMAIYTDDGRSFVVDRSSVNSSGLYLRIGHDFSAEADPKAICAALRADEVWLAGLYRLEI